MTGNKDITLPELRNLQYKKLKFDIYTDYTKWRDSLRGGQLIESKPIIAFFSDLLNEVLDGIVKYEGYEKQIVDLNKVLAEVKAQLDTKDKKLAQIMSNISNMTSEARQVNPAARFMD